MKIQNVILSVVGVTFTNEDTGVPRQDVLSNCKIGDMIILEREPNNQYDKNAIKVLTLYGQIGYIGKEYAKILAEQMDGYRKKFVATIIECDIYKGKWYCKIKIDERDE